MSPADLVARVRAVLDEDEWIALAATPGPWLADVTGTVVAAADVKPDGQGGEILPPEGPMEVAECYRNERTGERGHNADHIARQDPAATLRRVAKTREILDEVERWRHHACSDGYYSCSQATEEAGYDVDVACLDEERVGRPCDCGLERRQMAIVGPLAEAYGVAAEEGAAT